MAVSETSRGRRLNLTLPPPGSWPELDKAAETYNTLVRDRKVTGTKLGGLKGELQRAIAHDRVTLAEALKEGKDVEESEKVAKIERDIKACERRLEALEEALDLAEGELIMVVDEYREDWLDEVAEDVAEAQAAYAQAVEAVAAAADNVLAKVAMLRFVRLFPEEETHYRVRGTNVLALRGLNGDPFSIYEVLQALRDDARVEFDPQAFRSRDPKAVQSQALHDARRANEEKGLGYMTDAERSLYESDPVGFFGGAGAKRIQPLSTRINGNETEDDDGE